MAETLVNRFKDLQLELKLWFFSWLALSGAIAAGFYALRSLEWRAAGTWTFQLWRDFLLARCESLLGLGHLQVAVRSNPFGFNWVPPDWLLDLVRNDLFQARPDIVSAWDRDFHLIASSPLYAALVLAGLALIFSSKKRS